MLPSAPAVSPLLEPIASETTGEDLILSGCPVTGSNSPCALACESTDEPSSLRASRLVRASLESKSQTIARARKSGVRFSNAPPVAITVIKGQEDMGAEAGVGGAATPKGRARRSLVLDAGHTPWTASEQPEPHVTVVPEPTAAFPAPAFTSPGGEADDSWAAGSGVRKRLSTNAGNTPRRSSVSVVTFDDSDNRSAANGDVIMHLPAADGESWSDGSSASGDDPAALPRSMRRSMDAGNTPKHCRVSLVQFETPGEGGASDNAAEVAHYCTVGEEQSSATVVGTSEWSHALQAVTPGTGAPSAEFGDVDTTPDGGEQGNAARDEPLWIVPDDASGVPGCTPEEVARLSLNAGHTPAPSRTTSMSGEVSVQAEGDTALDGDLTWHGAAAPPAPHPAQSAGLGAAVIDVVDTAAQLNFNTHGAERVNDCEGGHVRCVKFPTNTADCVVPTGGRPSVGSVITPFVRAPTLLLCLHPAHWCRRLGR